LERDQQLFVSNLGAHAVQLVVARDHDRIPRMVAEDLDREARAAVGIDEASERAKAIQERPAHGDRELDSIPFNLDHIEGL
jgi:hypothetical protein